MAFRIPSFADLPEVNPRPSGTQPVYPAEDPGAAGLAALGKGVSAVGGTLANIGADREDARQKLNESNSTLDMVNRIVPLMTKISTETDPNKIVEYRKELDSILPTSAQAIDDPQRKQAWMARHAKTILDAHSDADKRFAGLYRGQAKADGLTRLDQFARTGASSSDPNAIPGTLAEMNNNLEWQQKNGSMNAEEVRVYRNHYTKQLIESRATHLYNTGRSDEALKLLNDNPNQLDPGVEERLRNNIQAGRNKSGGLRAVDEALGIVPAQPPRSSGGMEVGGAIGTRISQEAQRNNIDPKDALATAQIESAMGRNLGSRGNIFQLGKTEWSAVGGGQMGEPDTDIKNGLAWMGKVKGELSAALGREPQGWEIYLAHQQGVGGATKLLNNPNTPAGQLLPPQNISANGGDPSAPASAFVGKWRATYQRTAVQVGGSGGDAAPRAGGRFDKAAGDSIAFGLVRHGGLGGSATANVTDEGAENMDAAGSRTPQQVLDYITAHPERFEGQTVLASSGLMNAGVSGATASLPIIGKQLDELKKAGANVVLVGVDQGKFRDYNAALETLAISKGIPFAGPLPTKDVHPGPKGYADYAAAAAKLIRGGAASPAQVPSGDPTPLDDIGTALVPSPLARPGAVAIPPRIVPAPSYFQARDAIMRNPNLNPESREYALDQLAHRFTRDSAVIRDLETRAKDDFANQQKAVASSLLGRVIRGEQIDSQVLAGLVEAQQISDDQYRALRVEASREVTQDDIPTFSAFSRRAYAGEDISADLWKAVANKQLKGTTAEGLQRTANSRRERGEDQVERAAYATLRTSAGMDAQERPMVDLDKTATENQMQLWSLAQQEWNRRVMIGQQDPQTGQAVREDPSAVLADMLPRYGRPIDNVAAYPKPRMGAVTKIEELPAVIQKTYEAHSRGGMTDAQLAEEEQLLDKLRSILEAQQKRAAAAATVPAPKAGDNAARGRVKAQ